jgi:hypothetical protein
VILAGLQALRRTGGSVHGLNDPAALPMGHPLPAMDPDEHFTRVSTDQPPPQVQPPVVQRPIGQQVRAHCIQLIQARQRPVQVPAELVPDERNALRGDVLQLHAIGNAHSARSSHQPVTAINAIFADLNGRRLPRNHQPGLAYYLLCADMDEHQLVTAGRRGVRACVVRGWRRRYGAEDR